MQKHKGRNEGYTKWNKEKSTWNQQWGEAGVQINDLEHKEEMNNQNRMKK